MKLIGTTGKPAAGKSVAARELSNALGCPMVEMGDVVTEKAASYLGVSASEMTSDQKGDAATELREKHGETVFAEETVKKAKSVGDEYCVISGVRTPEEISVFESSADFTLVLVTAPFETRYKRFTSRGREDEADFSRDDFKNRNERELGWGLDRVLSQELYDISIENEGSVSQLSSRVESLVDEL